MSCSEYPASLKYADITPVFKKDDKTVKTNYRPICILPNLNKIYERFMQNQMYPYVDQIFSKYHCGFRKGYNAQHCLMTMIEKWHKFLDVGRGGSRVHLVRRMTKSRFLKKLDTFYGLRKYERS